MDMQEVDFGLSRELRWRTFRRRFVLVAGVLCILEFVGAPTLRVSDAESGQPARYVTVEGAMDMPQSSTQPLIVMVPLERAIFARVGDVVSALWEEWFRA